MRLTATVVYSVNVDIEVPDFATVEEQATAIRKEACRADLDLHHPIIHDCSNEALID